MGACDFYQSATGSSAKEAFKNAVEQAAWESGHGGYTGTIAEKGSFTIIDLPKGYTPSDYADELIRDNDERISDKWGPAGCIAMKDNKYLFFGIASS